MVAGRRGKGYKQRQGSRWLCILLLRVGGVHRTPSNPLVPTPAQLVPLAQGAASTLTNYTHTYVIMLGDISIHIFFSLTYSFLTKRIIGVFGMKVLQRLVLNCYIF